MEDFILDLPRFMWYVGGPGQGATTPLCGATQVVFQGPSVKFQTGARIGVSLQTGIRTPSGPTGASIQSGCGGASTIPLQQFFGPELIGQSTVSQEDAEVQVFEEYATNIEINAVRARSAQGGLVCDGQLTLMLEQYARQVIFLYPGMDWCSLCRSIRGFPPFKVVPVQVFLLDFGDEGIANGSLGPLWSGSYPSDFFNYFFLPDIE